MFALQTFGCVCFKHLAPQHRWFPFGFPLNTTKKGYPQTRTGLFSAPKRQVGLGKRAESYGPILCTHHVFCF